MSVDDDRELRFAPTDAPLRDDVRTLGALVGEILREQGGDALFRDVETARVAAIRRREGHADAAATLEAALAGRAPDDAEALVRAFATYFQVVNLAERVHRLRRRRDYLRSGTTQPGSLLDTVGRLRDAGLDAGAARAVLGRLRLEPVFTAHPTEATRRTVLRKQQRIARQLVDRMDPSLTPPEAQALLGRIRAEVTAGWQTEEHPSQRLTVDDEREHVLFFLTEVLYRVVPPFYEALDDAFATVYGPDAAAAPMPAVLSFASWVGGDMDGNPNVTAATLRATLERHRELILRRYLGELTELYGELSQSRGRAGFSAALEERLAADPLRAEVSASMHPRHREMPYRVLLALVHRHLELTLAGEETYGAGDLAADLRLAAASLADNRGEHAGLFGVRRMLRRVETFGFHLATLDVRQDAAVHRRVVGRLLGEEGWQERPAAERAERLRRALVSGVAPAGDGDEEAEATLDVFRAIGESIERYGRRAVGPYIVSMAQGVDDVLSVLALARWAGLAGDDGHVPLDVAPLFETVPDLEAAGRVMTELLSDEAGYRDHVRRRGERQVVMIGYSDSNKDGGLAASRWALHGGQRRLVAALASTGVGLEIFHGRGGTVSRGGGKIARAVAAMPPGALARGVLRVTEQGEMINAKFGLRGIALRTLEQTASAVALAVATPPPARPEEDAWHAAMDELARASRDAYRALVYDTPGFHDYFRGATPIDVIERLRIGSRPASRRANAGIGSLRAIPWVFAWTQSRHVLPGWYGLGTGLEAAARRHGGETLSAMAREWPFLRALLDDAENVLAKVDLEIASRYAALAGDGGAAIFDRVRAEYERTVEQVLAVKGSAGLLDEDPVLQRSIRLRNPYVDPMSLLQVDLLRRWRAASRADDALLAALFATVGGIAQGLQNTG
ncbi:MAG TPA: phosphoenolpyruvate carboxylase [Thermoanaerobaculia bacterium]